MRPPLTSDAVATMTAGEINKALDRLDKEGSKLMERAEPSPPRLRLDTRAAVT